MSFYPLVNAVVSEPQNQPQKSFAVATYSTYYGHYSLLVVAPMVCELPTFLIVVVISHDCELIRASCVALVTLTLVYE